MVHHERYEDIHIHEIVTVGPDAREHASDRSTQGLVSLLGGQQKGHARLEVRGSRPSYEPRLDALDEYADEQQASLVVVSHDREVMARFDDTLDVSGFSALTPPVSDGGDNHA